MGRKTKVIELTETAKRELEEGYKYSESVQFSRRCHYILLKSQGKTSEEIATIFDVTIQPINKWCKQYQQHGIKGLQTKSGQGRKPIFDKEKDETVVKATVQKERQRLKQAKDILEEDLGKSFSLKTLQRFLKALAADGNE
ncbi:helix-turn-helix domain-containing protein [Flammeovirga aprica]|uniref:Helix-turn-helix domain-containing protein n=1 Tax=Flammeovirga aprica JL-4 TaxID=694437 RepID=A0A7X9S296_9BACT|nr:helix-turn-helix domain-containing protein [Flammeovirga aprica]NME73065.1 helix-turn-helix domain-containing protein [Flammeovirga aprica JL-4]